MKEKIPCLICEKPTNGKLLVNYDNANGKIIAPEVEPNHGQYGALPIGSDCARKLIKAGTPRHWFFKA